MIETTNLHFFIDVKWLPEKKIRIVKKKLNGVKPSVITCQELSLMHEFEMETDDANSHFSHYTTFVNGADPRHESVRISIKSDDLTSDEQVRFVCFWKYILYQRLYKIFLWRKFYNIFFLLQVQCLLDQAKDLNLLGRMYVGWQPFV